MGQPPPDAAQVETEKCAVLDLSRFGIFLSQYLQHQNETLVPRLGELNLKP